MTALERVDAHGGQVRALLRSNPGAGVLIIAIVRRRNPRHPRGMGDPESALVDANPVGTAPTR